MLLLAVCDSCGAYEQCQMLAACECAAPAPYLVNSLEYLAFLARARSLEDNDEVL